MPNDARLGMVVGLGLVIALAVIFFRGAGASPAANVSSSVANQAPAERSKAARPGDGPVSLQPASRPARPGIKE